MSKMPVVSDKEPVEALGRMGYELDHQSGSHLILRRVTPPHRRLSIPNHKEIAKGILRMILNEAGLSLEQFYELLK